MLALGHPLPQDAARPGRSQAWADGYIADPWSAGALDDLAAGRFDRPDRLRTDRRRSDRRGPCVAGIAAPSSPSLATGFFPAGIRHRREYRVRTSRSVRVRKRNRSQLAQASAVGGGCLPGTGQRLAIGGGFASPCHANAVAIPGRRRASTVRAASWRRGGTSIATASHRRSTNCYKTSGIGTSDRRGGPSVVSWRKQRRNDRNVRSTSRSR